MNGNFNLLHLSILLFSIISVCKGLKFPRLAYSSDNVPNKASTYH